MKDTKRKIKKVSKWKDPNHLYLPLWHPMRNWFRDYVQMIKERNDKTD